MKENQCVIIYKNKVNVGGGGGPYFTFVDLIETVVVLFNLY